ncbi:MAG: AAA family ATPase [Bdellovibrionales bacterium]
MDISIVEIGKYKVIRPISEGSAGRVYLVERDGKEYALKHLKDSSADTLVRFRRESSTLARLNNEHLTKIHDVGEFQERPYIVMDLLQGITLEAELARSGKLSQELSIEILRSVAKALTELHRNNLIHRDIKPSNIFITKTGSVRLIDLGLVGEVDQIRSETALVGTPLYCSPEQCRILKRDVDFRSDLYSLGVTAFTVLAGRPPYLGSVSEILQQHASKVAPSVIEFNSQVTRSLAAVIDKLLAKDPDDRYQSVMGLLADLERLNELEAALDKGLSLQLGQHDSRTLTTRVKYVERKAESEVLNQAWKAIVSGAPGAVIVTGVSGSGKSRLCEEFINSISPDRPLVLRAKCQFFDRDLPLGPIREALDTLLEEIESRPSEERQQGIANIQKAAQGYEDKLVSLTKSLIKILPSAKSPRLKGSEAEGDQEAFFNSIADFFARLCEYARPAVFFIDDLQWLDKSSQQLLQALFASERMKSFLLIATARDDDESRDYVAKIENLLGSHIKERLSVRPFDETQLSHLLAQYLGAATISQKIVHSIFTRSKGNPFIAIEYLRAGIEQGFLQFKEQTWQLNNEALQTIELADNVYDLIIRRIENSSENSKKVLQYAALCGNIVNSSDIQAVAGISAEAMNDLVDNCVNLGLAEKLNPSKWKFIHDKIPESLVSSIPDEVRRSMNDKLATFFFNKADKSHKEIFLVVRLFRAGNLEAHLEPALIAHKHAGEAALSNYAYVEAYDLFKFCFERSSGSQAKSEDMRLTMDLALCAAMVGDEPLAIGCADKAVGLAEGKAELAHALSLKTWILSVQSQPVEAWETFKWASSLIGHNYPVYMHWKLIQLVWTWMLSLILEFVPIRLPKTFFFGARDLDIQKVCGLYRDAYMLCMLRGELLDQVVVSLKLLTLGQLVGGMREKALGYACVCYCYGVFGLKRLAFAYAEKSRRSCLELNDPTTAALCEWRILMSFYMCGLIQDYRKEYLEKKDLFHKYLPPAELGRFIVNIANAYYITGLRDQALENYQFLIDLANKNVVRMPKNFVCTSLNLSWSCLALAGRQQESDRVRTVALEVNHELRFNPWAVRGTMIAEILAHRGTEELDQTIEQVTTAFWKRGGKRLVDPTLNYISVELTFIRFLQFKRARTQEERFSTELEFRAMMRHLYTTVFCPVMRSSYHYLVAAYALARGHLHQARKQYEVAEQYASDTGCLPILFEIQRDRARMHLQLGNLELMKLHLSSAIDLAARNNWRVHLGSLMKEFEPYVSPQAPIFRQSLSGSHHSSNTQSTVGVTRMGSMVSGSLSSGSLSAGSSAGSSLAHTSSAGRSSTLSATIMANRLGHRVSVEEMRFVDSLLNVTSAFVKSSNAKEQSAAVLSEIVKLFGAQRGFIFMSDDETGGLTVVAGKSSDGTDLEKLTGFSATVVNNVKETQKPMVVTGTEEGEALGSESAVLHNLRSIMATPLTLNETKGVVYLDSSLSKGLFTENDIELFSTLANHISVSFELSRMAMVEFEKAQLQKEYEIQHVMLEASQKVKVLVDNMQQALFSVDANGLFV